MPIEESRPGEWTREVALQEVIDKVDSERAAYEKRVAEGQTKELISVPFLPDGCRFTLQTNSGIAANGRKGRRASVGHSTAFRCGFNCRMPMTIGGAAALWKALHKT